MVSTILILILSGTTALFFKLYRDKSNDYDNVKQQLKNVLQLYNETQEVLADAKNKKNAVDTVDDAVDIMQQYSAD